jgi:hypothetical protein
MHTLDKNAVINKIRAILPQRCVPVIILAYSNAIIAATVPRIILSVIPTFFFILLLKVKQLEIYHNGITMTNNQIL